MDIHVDQFVPELHDPLTKSECHPSLDIGHGMSCGHASWYYYVFLRVTAELLPVLDSVKANSQLELCSCVRAGLSCTWLERRVQESKHVCWFYCVCACMSPVRQSCRSLFPQVALIAVPLTNCEGSSCSFTPGVIMWLKARYLCIILIPTL